MRKKRLITALVSVGLLAVIGIGATLAYLTDTTEEVANTFTVGDVKINLTEPNWDPEKAQDMKPGSIVAKDPQVTNTGQNDGYIVMTVIGMNAMREADFEAIFDDQHWALVDSQGRPLATEETSYTKYNPSTGNIDTIEGKKLVDGYYVYKGTTSSGTNPGIEGVVAPGRVTEPLFSEVKYLEKAKGSSFNGHKVTGKYLKNGGDPANWEDYLTGEQLEAQKELFPQVGEDGKYTIGYFVDDETTIYHSYDEAEDYIYANWKDAAHYQFEIDLQAFTIQSSHINFNPYTNWVSDALNGMKNLDKLTPAN